MKKWEYQLVVDDWAHVEKLGKAGWELVAVTEICGKYSTEITYYLKRPKK